MLNATMMHKFIAENGKEIFVDGNFDINKAWDIALEQDSTVGYFGCAIKWY